MQIRLEPCLNMLEEVDSAKRPGKIYGKVVASELET